MKFRHHHTTLVIILTISSIYGENATNSENDDPSVTWKVVGGSLAFEHQFPYIASLRDNFNRHFCGGSIINPEWIVTAAHCLRNANPANVNVVVGTNYLDRSGVKYPSRLLIIHPNYGGAHKNDIALIRVAYPIKFDGTVRPIELGQIGDGKFGAVLSGWGGLQKGALPANSLQRIRLTTLSTADCRTLMPEVDPGQICTFVGHGQGACQGDSGGPLVSDDRLIGVVSYGIPCAKGFPDIFTRVSYHYNWIRQFTG